MARARPVFSSGGRRCSRVSSSNPPIWGWDEIAPRHTPSFLRWPSPPRHAGDFRFGIITFPSRLARSIARRPKPRLLRLRQTSLARLDRDHLGRNWRRAASCNREAAGSKQRALTRRWRLSPMAAQSERWVKRLASVAMARPWTGLGWPFRLGGKENANRNRHRF
jgi:hypothetical protein